MLENIESFTYEDLIDSLQYVYEDNYGDVERAKAKGLILKRAKDIGQSRSVLSVVKALEKSYIQRHQEVSAFPIPASLLQLDTKGVPEQTIDNFRSILENDPYYNQGAPYYQRFFYNDLSNRAEIHTFDKQGNLTEIRPWTDADEAESLAYIERTYNGLYNKEKHFSALRLVWRNNRYNPITLQLNSLRNQWDGVPRCENFLTTWMRADNSAYTRAVSRMIFDGAVSRAFRPATKFDIVPTLISGQGAGKSTICRFLALHDDFYGELLDFDRSEQVNIEAITGRWIVELGEIFLSPAKRAQNKVKAFLTRLRDSYRMPYDRSVSDLDRRCIFIATTNNEEFLTDMTGNRRFFPVTVHCNGRTIFRHEQEIRDYIRMCYAEAVAHFDAGEAWLTIPEELIAEAENRQANAMQSDWRYDMILEYVTEQMQVGDSTYIRHAWQSICHGDIAFLTKSQEQEIATILSSIPLLRKESKPKRVNGEVNKQRIYVKIDPSELKNDS